jgi:hypothetical protein
LDDDEQEELMDSVSQHEIDNGIRTALQRVNEALESPTPSSVTIPMTVNIPPPTVQVTTPAITTGEIRVSMPDLPPATVIVNPPNVVLPPQNITVQVPEQLPPNIKINVPEQSVPQVHVTPNITVQVPEQPAPQVTVNVPEQKTPIVNVEVPKPLGETSEIIRDSRGFIIATDKQIRYDH